MNSWAAQSNINLKKKQPSQVSLNKRRAASSLCKRTDENREFHLRNIRPNMTDVELTNAVSSIVMSAQTNDMRQPKPSNRSFSEVIKVDTCQTDQSEEARCCRCSPLSPRFSPRLFVSLLRAWWIAALLARCSQRLPRPRKDLQGQGKSPADLGLIAPPQLAAALFAFQSSAPFRLFRFLLTFLQLFP